MNSTVHPTFAHMLLPHKFTDDAALHEPLRRFNTVQYRTLLAELQGLQQEAASRGDAFIGGAHFGPLDAYTLTLLRWGSMFGIDPADNPTLWAHVQKVAQLPAVASVLERERVPLSMYKPS
jgi:glutathione S-transferase